MTHTAPEQTSGKKLEISKNIHNDKISPRTSGGKIVPEVLAEAQGIKHKPTEGEIKPALSAAQTAAQLLSADEMRKLKQAQKQLEWQKKRMQSKVGGEGVAGGVVYDEDAQDGYDLNELVSEGW